MSVSSDSWKLKVTSILRWGLAIAGWVSLVAAPIYGPPTGLSLGWLLMGAILLLAPCSLEFYAPLAWPIFMLLWISGRRGGKRDRDERLSSGSPC